jgi:hypothetical protein
VRSFLAAISLIALPDPVFAAPIVDRAAVALAGPQELIVDGSLSGKTVSAMSKPVDAFTGVWNNGSETLFDQAIAPTFEDHTLPLGRPQGPSGPVAADSAFLAAVP